MMVVRREEKGLRRYCHLGTGNYHAKTARLYTDYGLLTADEQIGEDIHEIFSPAHRTHARASLAQAAARALQPAPGADVENRSRVGTRARAASRRRIIAKAQRAHGAHDHRGAV